MNNGMNDKNNHSGEDTYDILHRQFSLFGGDDPVQPEEEDVKNSGEIYFSASPDIQFGRAEPERDDGIDWSRFEESSARRAAPGTAGNGAQARRSSVYQGDAGRVPAADASPQRRSAAPSGGRVSSSAGRTTSSAGRTATSFGRAASGGSRKPASGASGRSGAAARPAKKPTTRTRASASKKSGKNDKGGAAGWILAMLMLVIVVVVSLILRVPIMGCINDIFAIDRSDTEIRVVIEPNMDTNDVIDLLGKKDLIYSSTFCKFVYRFLGHDPKEIYPAGAYDVSADMGLEGMMREIITAGATEDTVSITFPEGYTIDQIIEKLASNGVASSSALYGVIDSVEFIQSYDFLTYIEDAEQRYHYLEGYMYPDTYEFYIGENPQSVINRFLKNFSEKWSEKFAARCEKSGYTMDEILTVASILEKEAKDAEQMTLIASILYNRLENSSFAYINCDSTAKYIDNQKEKLVASGRYASLLKVYDTYQITGLPIGPICSPGADAIDAALDPDSTDYYYFIHDADGKIYVASTLAEHEANRALAGLD